MRNGKKNSVNNIEGAPFKGALISGTAEKIIYFIILSSVLVFILWPILAVLFESIFIDGNIDLTNYYNIFTENRELLSNSIFVSVTSTLISVTIGLCIALYITHSNNKGKKIILAVLVLTMISPPFVSSLAYIMLFGRRGIITYKLFHILWNPYGAHGIIIMQSIGHASLAALLIYGILKGIDKNLEQASLDAGASSTQTLFHVTIPLASPGILASALIVFVKSLSDFGTPIIIGGNYSVLATEAYLNVIGLYNLPKAAAMSTLLMIPALIMFIVYRRIMNKSQFYNKKTASSGDSKLKLPVWVNSILLIVTWSFALLMILKYSTIFYGAFAKTWGVDFSFSLRHINKLNPRKISSLVRSLQYSFTAGILGSVIGLLISYVLERKRFVGSEALDFITTLPFMIPGTFFGIGYILAFNDYPLALTGTAFIVVVNCIYRQLPIATKASTSVLSQMNEEVEQSASDLGAKGFHVFKDIVMPQLKPAFLISFINTFTTTMTTIGSIIFLITPSSRVATIEMFDAINNGEIGLGCVYASIIIIIVLFVNLSFSKIVLKNSGGDNKAERGEEYVSSIERVN